MPFLQPSEFQDVIDLIKAVAMARNIETTSRPRCRPGCGHNAATVIDSMHTHVPENTLSDEQINDLLTRARRQGVLTVVCSETTEFDSVDCNFVTTELLYGVNHEMARVNRANQQYATYYNGVETPDHSYDSGNGISAVLSGVGGNNTYSQLSTSNL